ncbi:hypothetical protein SprV_0501915900 [Sparganum proliferum]
MAEFILRDQRTLWYANQWHRACFQRRRQYPPDREDTNYTAMGRTFRGVLSRPSTICDAAIARLPQVETTLDLDLLPSLHETIRAVQQLSSGKAPGADAIPAEIYKHGGPQLMDYLTALFQEMWPHGADRHDLKDAAIVHLCMRNGTANSVAITEDIPC